MPIWTPLLCDSSYSAVLYISQAFLKRRILFENFEFVKTVDFQQRYYAFSETLVHVFWLQSEPQGYSKLI